VQNKVFFPQEALDQCVIDGTVELSGHDLTILAEARRYRIAEAVLVLREVTGSPDANDLVGKVKSKLFLDELGAEILERSMIIGENAYDVVPGWLGAPSTPFEEHVKSVERAKARASRPEFAAEEPRTDEDLLARFLTKHL
jgi:hypothetical protein